MHATKNYLVNLDFGALGVPLQCVSLGSVQSRLLFLMLLPLLMAMLLLMAGSSHGLLKGVRTARISGIERASSRSAHHAKHTFAGIMRVLPAVLLQGKRDTLCAWLFAIGWHPYIKRPLWPHGVSRALLGSWP